MNFIISSQSSLALLLIAVIKLSGVAVNKRAEYCMQNLDVFSHYTFIFLIYPFVSKVVVSTFNCQDLGDSGSWLKSDMRLPCPLASSNFSKTWSIIFTFVFPVGVPYTTAIEYVLLLQNFACRILIHSTVASCLSLAHT